jgi:hypothetical protein
MIRNQTGLVISAPVIREHRNLSKLLLRKFVNNPGKIESTSELALDAGSGSEVNSP